MIDKFMETKRGKAAAKRDIAFVKQFMDEHNQNPHPDVAARFFRAMSESADEELGRGAASNAYRKLTAKFEEDFIASRQAEGAELVHLQVPREFMDELQRTGITHEWLDKMAKEHGHYTREEECDPLRKIRESLDDQ